MSALILMVASSILVGPWSQKQIISESGHSLRQQSLRLPLKTDWGFSCYIQGLEKTILFDTGGRGEILVSNLEKMGLSPENIEVVVLSHYHGDHTGGLDEILRLNPRIEVWVPEHFPKDFKQRLREKGPK
jgi:7,8-dihydropterin-6-yl-methyl-4-(beta-D-ribofuranosyl)aminobenzene 5'-phosphate synthase